VGASVLESLSPALVDVKEKIDEDVVHCTGALEQSASNERLSTT
jgi:hypothetical protein